LVVVFLNVLVVLGHPNKCSFNHALARATVMALQQMGHTAVFHDLYTEGFNPVLEQAEMGAIIDPNLRRNCEDLANAEGIVVVHPIWWGQPPAIIKGWVDRVFRRGIAYRFKESGEPEGLLRAKKAVIFNTSNTPAEMEESRCRDSIAGLWKTCVFDTCGVGRVERKLFSPLITSTSEQRAAWLKEAAETIQRQFG
jgi:NAD(P)H dehydrogenase (quinone)